MIKFKQNIKSWNKLLSIKLIYNKSSRKIFPLFVVLYLFFSNVISLMANDISLPSYPVDPGFPQVEQSQNNKSTEVKNQIPPSTMKVEIIAILGTSDEVRGFIILPEKISFKHYKNGLVYDKNISPDELQSISILEYLKQDNNQDNSKEGTKKPKMIFYQFEPSTVEIKLKDNSTYRIQKIFSFLKSFNIDTNNGRTRLYTIFGDSYEKQKGWRDSESKDPDFHKTHSHPASVKKIIFLRIEKEP
ncbi:MAG: hypothetical protein OEV78_03200 [Spirochaetia bacterium]|nr:hypothetical protein [Spirochaetia bacterium]